MDEENRRRRALEAGKEMLENYKSKRSSKRLSNKVTDQSMDEESFIIEPESQSIDLRSINNNDSLLSRDVTYGSISMSEGEGDGDLEGLAGRVIKLKEVLQGKEADFEALNAEYDVLRADASSPTSSHSQNSSIPNKDLILTYHTKLQEFERAVNQRDNLIEDLTTSLQQALAARDTLLAQMNVLNSSQIGNSNGENFNDEKILELESALSNQKEIVSELTLQLQQAQQNVKKLEYERDFQNTELTDYKDQIQNLNEKIRANSFENNANDVNQVPKQYEEQIEKIKKDMKIILEKFAAETNSNNVKHENEMKELRAKYENEIQKLKKENNDLEIKYSKEISTLKSQLHNYENHIERVENDLLACKKNHAREKDLLTEQIKLHKIQLEEMTSKYIATSSILDSKESIERSLEQALSEAAALKTENDSLKFKLDDLTSRYSAAQSLIENNQLNERNLSNKIFHLEKSLSRLSGVSFSELDETAYQTIDEIALQYQIAKQKLEEKASMEQELVTKIQSLEDMVSQTQKELETANLAKESYEKQIKDMKNTCDRLKAELNSNLDKQSSNLTEELEMQRMKSLEFEQEIHDLKENTERRDQEIAEYIRKLNSLNEKNQKLAEESEKLRNGLNSAYALLEEKLDQTLGTCGKLEETNINETIELDESSFEHSSINQSNYYKVLAKLETCCNQLEEFERERVQLIKEIEENKKENQRLQEVMNQKDEQYNNDIKILHVEISATNQKYQRLLQSYEEGDIGMRQLRIDLEEKHAKEMEEVRKYFEQKCLEMEKQYSEEVFSQQSKKISDNDSEIEELTEDLVGTSLECGDGAGGDAGNTLMDKNDLISMSEQQKSIYEERIAKIITEYEEKFACIKKQLQEVKEQSGRTVLLKAVNQFCQTDQYNLAPSQDSHNELNELRADYKRQLEEQVGLARIDIISALQEQIEALINADADSDDNWPTELLELRNKFTSNSKREIQALKERHVLEINCIKQENNLIIHELQEEIKKIKSESHESLQANLVRERDKLQKTCETLKGLVAQLVDYFAECEEELNSTIINEVLRKQPSFRPDATLDAEANFQAKRVRFAPQSSEIASIVRSDSNLLDLINNDKDIMTSLKSDLEACLQRLKADSARILNASFSDSESWSTGIGDSPRDKLFETEKKVSTLQTENERLKVKVIDLQQRLRIAENKKEIISEGYGEQDETGDDEQSEDFSQLQDRAKYVIMNGCNDASYLLQLIEEIMRQTEKTMEEARKERDDLQNQIEAADKQLRLTRKFQEEQADERELERDEAAKQIQQLTEKLREREREKDRDQRNTSVEHQSALSPDLSSSNSSLRQQYDDSETKESVEALTVQLRELEAKKAETDNELRQAVSKIWELREVIRDLEQQIQTRAEREDILNGQIEQLEEVIVAQTRNQQELSQELEAIRAGNENNQLSDHIGHLQEELRKHQLSSEQLTANSSALRQLRLELRDLQSQLERKTRELESLHVCGSSLSISQPSEDVSIRDQIDATRCPTPDDPTSPPILPLDNVLKLKDTLFKHFRVEDVALKRLKDLDIQLGGVQRQNEELLAEQELLQQTTSEQLFQIETLRARLEQLKQNAPFAQRQATCRLETQLYEVNDKLKLTERALLDKEIELSEVKTQLERVSRLLAEKDAEIVNVVQTENDVVKKIKEKLEISEDDKRALLAKLAIYEKAQNIPLINVISEKNEEIEQLKAHLAKREKQLDIYLSLDEAQLRELLRQNEKHSARTLSDILSINSECEDESEEALRETSHLTKMQNMSNFQGPLLQTKDHVDFSQAIGETPKVPRLELGLNSHSSDNSDSHIIRGSNNVESMQFQHTDKITLSSVNDSDETHESSSISEDPNNFCPRHGHLQETIDEPANGTLTNNEAVSNRIEELEMQINKIREELESKTALLHQRESELIEIQSNLEQLHENIESLNADRLFYKNEYEKSKDNELKIQRDLEEVETILKMRNEELDEFKEKVQLNDRMLHEQAIRSETALSEKLEEIINLKEVLAEKDTDIHQLQQRLSEIENEHMNLLEYKRKVEAYQQQIVDNQGEIRRLSDGLNSRDLMIRRLEDMARNMSTCSTPNEKNQEIMQLQGYIQFKSKQEKDKVIRQMSDDGKSIHRALETIQKKINESGNVIDLQRKLKEERKQNIELIEEIAKLRTELEMMNSSRRQENEQYNIAEKVQRELNLSANLDRQLMNAIENQPKNTKTHADLAQANKEIEELYRFKDDLEIEREMLKSQIVEYENRIMQLKTDAEEESKRISKLEEDLAKERHAVRSLSLQLQREKNMAEEDKARDTELIRELRIKLDEASELRDKLVMEIKSLEVINSMKAQNKSEIPEGLEAEYKKQQLELKEKLNEEERKHSETNERLLKIESDRSRIQSQLDAAQEEIEKLTVNLEAANCAKDNMKADLRKAKEELKAKSKEVEWHKNILKTMNDAENKRKQRKSEEHNTIKTLRRDLKNAHEVMMDCEADMKSWRQQLAESAEREAQLTRCIESLTDKETELTEQLNAARNEEKKLRNIITEQQNELKLFLKRELELAEELKRERLTPDLNFSPSKVLQRVKDLNATIERLTQDKIHLCERSNRLREENERYLEQIRFLETQLTLKGRSSQAGSSTGSDSDERLQHFYGKYLRAESRRKALTFQKSYLLCVLGGYQLSTENTLTFLARLTQPQQSYVVRRGRNKKNPRVRFRSAVLMIISIQRIKWLILRWRTGRRVGANVVLGNIERPAVLPSPSTSRRANAAGNSPPVREKVTNGTSGIFSSEPFQYQFTDVAQNLNLQVPEYHTISNKMDQEHDFG